MAAKYKKTFTVEMVVKSEDENATVKEMTRLLKEKAGMVGEVKIEVKGVTEVVPASKASPKAAAPAASTSTGGSEPAAASEAPKNEEAPQPPSEATASTQTAAASA